MIFFIKATILLSRVHTLIRDSRRAQLLGYVRLTRQCHGDSDPLRIQSRLGVSAQAYHAQRHDIDSFYLSIPRYWKTLFKEDGVDFDILLCLLGTFLCVAIHESRSSTMHSCRCVTDRHRATIHMSELIPFVEPPLPTNYDSGSATAALNILAIAESRESSVLQYDESNSASLMPRPTLK